MSFDGHTKGCDPKIEPGQITRPECFPPPNELVCIQVPKVFDQVALRDCVTRNKKMVPGHGVTRPVFSFEGADEFDIVQVKVISKTEVAKPCYKKLKLFVRIRYNIHYSDGVNQLSEYDEAGFNLTVNEIYCPNCFAEIGMVRYPAEEPFPGTLDVDGLLIKVEALPEAFNDSIVQLTGVLSLDIGAFFIVKCECFVQLLMPSFGYCPVPPEQENPATRTCTTFNNMKKTPFPTAFFPDQKWNPLDRPGCRD